ncbi:isocitrate lyase/phosphoenolpyruvate mutase family protein [Mucilaginibacter rubeus]|uniref:Isocitrate lyase/phosphoenolpyruvate mutase family protein n=1 Tax=Mucilaginibacter rubeus TaxID=2027860 RepID=A0AAE6JGR0_9SPHI|nr:MULTISPECIES: isocitrate lyase/phosphoenolpyruvate mutase family protein [Mucilaginibacter]QEM04725.1 isocitrate lyase/phosphoenolpyruvate mutase family protein [Mucilaginibacter rubeus]QEM17319.1 isocitrate lyase/phosphoenolpyruvate mutase family protein [Mucilaginibacter gossypii]QTE46167.1 isocitrate lyase/phosphoenolpyruvate mutase family protein [Mucilaginibacter rubeus]QTE52765.1 isocitrate lyase/phosphoenolpyruvate mutase family protein [Mucilaginibacter rubeus]QTE57852.1 isocitrate 
MSSAINNSQYQKAEVFKALHERDDLFIIPNPWDAGSAKILTGLGFEAFTTTSAGLAYALGRPDGYALISRDETLDNARAIINATHLPVAADLENGFGDTPEICAETILVAAGVGLVGGSIEDATGNDKDPIYNFDLSVARVKAAVEAARSLPFHFMLTARAENMIHRKIDLQDTIKRLIAYADAGADVLFAPGLKTREQISEVVKAVAPKPVNIVLGAAGFDISFNELADLGVKRVSLGSALARAALGAFQRAAVELSQGSYGFVNDAVPYSELNKIFGK